MAMYALKNPVLTDRSHLIERIDRGMNVDCVAAGATHLRTGSAFGDATPVAQVPGDSFCPSA
jgi:hypothetical protein